MRHHYAGFDDGSNDNIPVSNAQSQQPIQNSKKKPSIRGLGVSGYDHGHDSSSLADWLASGFGDEGIRGRGSWGGDFYGNR